MAWRHRWLLARGSPPKTQVGAARRRPPRVERPRAAGPSSASTSGRRTATWRYTWGIPAFGHVVGAVLSLDYTGCSGERAAASRTRPRRSGASLASRRKAGDATYRRGETTLRRVVGRGECHCRAAPNTTVVASLGATRSTRPGLPAPPAPRTARTAGARRRDAEGSPTALVASARTRLVPIGADRSPGHAAPSARDGAQIATVATRASARGESRSAPPTGVAACGLPY